MKIRLIRRYGTKQPGDILGSVRPDLARRFVKNGIAVLVEEKPKKKARKK